MFTLTQIAEANSKIKSGAHFTKYIEDLVLLGVRSYATYVEDGHMEFSGRGNFNIQSPPKYNSTPVASQADRDRFESLLWQYQMGNLDYATFCRLAAEYGVDKWHVDTLRMTCSYFDKSGALLLEQRIPG